MQLGGLLGRITPQMMGQAVSPQMPQFDMGPVGPNPLMAQAQSPQAQQQLMQATQAAKPWFIDQSALMNAGVGMMQASQPKFSAMPAPTGVGFQRGQYRGLQPQMQMMQFGRGR